MIYISMIKANKGEIGHYFGNNEKNKTLGGATSQKSQKESKTHDISTPLGTAWVSKDVWLAQNHPIGLGCCFLAKIEQTLKISQKAVTFH